MKYFYLSLETAYSAPTKFSATFLINLLASSSLRYRQNSAHPVIEPRSKKAYFV
jgi:hypothetical protein